MTALPWRRLGAIGDSIVEGVREPAEGFRDLGWVDRVAEALDAASAEPLVVRNLARRNLVAAEVRARQLDDVLAFGPDLVVLSAGGNDLLRRRFDAAAVEHELDVMVGALRAAEADVLTLDLFDAAASPYVPDEVKATWARRIALLVDVTRAVSARHGAIHAELRDHPAAADPEIYASDGLHLNARGHAVVGAAAVAALEAAAAQRLRPGAPPSSATARRRTARAGAR